MPRELNDKRTELVWLAMPVDEGRRGDTVKVSPERAKALYAAGAAEPLSERVRTITPTDPPGTQQAATGDVEGQAEEIAPHDGDEQAVEDSTAGTVDPDGESGGEPDVPAGDGEAGEQSRVAVRRNAGGSRGDSEKRTS